MRRYGFQSLLLLLLALALPGCGSGGSGSNGGGGGGGGVSDGPSVSQLVTRAAGATLKAGNVTMIIPPNGLTKDANVKLVDTPLKELPRNAISSGLLGFALTQADSGAVIDQHATLMIPLPANRVNTYPLYAYKTGDGKFAEVDMTVSQDGKFAVIDMPKMGLYVVYSLRLGPVPQQPNAQTVGLEPLTFKGIYGDARVRVKNLLDPTATVTVRVAGKTSPSAKIAFTDANTPDNNPDKGGAIDFRVPAGLAANTQDLVVTINGHSLPSFRVKVVDANPFAVFTLAKGGSFVAELYHDKSPKTVDNFTGLATGSKKWTNPCTGQQVNTPLYDGTLFHRVVTDPDLNIRQGGDPRSKCPTDQDPAGTGGPGFTIPFENNSLKHVEGAIAMARGPDKNSAGSQFYICASALPNLDGNYVVFGQVLEGLDIAKGIVANDVLASVIITSKIEPPTP